MTTLKNTGEPRFNKGNRGNHEYIVGHTPVDIIMHIDQVAPKADITGLKYSQHLAGDKRSGGDAAADDQHRLTMLVSGGPWKQEMWLDGGERETLELSDEGDYIAWEPGYCHTWEAVGDATMLTISFRRRE
ncbi:MAG: hypothetical protein MI807_13115 [Verrucomicrobiales bacterium]|nr:hypothetical protein [Verrucomicrobiales bacterium]